MGTVTILFILVVVMIVELIYCPGEDKEEGKTKNKTEQVFISVI